MSSRTSAILGVTIIALFVWFVLGVVVPDFRAARKVDNDRRDTIMTIGADGREGQRWEHVRVRWDSNAEVSFFDQQGHEIRITGPRIRIKE